MNPIFHAVQNRNFVILAYLIEGRVRDEYGSDRSQLAIAVDTAAGWTIGAGSAKY
jgi:hypothetical protein